MPILNDPNMGQQSLHTGHYGFSATRIEDLGATEYTLVTIVNDVSPSVADFVQEMETALREILKACKYSLRADNLLVRLVTFSRDMEEVHGFKLLDQCRLDDYQGVLRIGCATALFDAAENAISAFTAYGKQLADAGFSVNGIVFVITDGEDNASRLRARHVREALAGALRTEALSSLISVLVGVNVADPDIGAYLQDFKVEAGFTQYVEIGGANASTLAQLAAFVTRSISTQSQSLASASAAPSLGF
jgi:hypothetical protein